MAHGILLHTVNLEPVSGRDHTQGVPSAEIPPTTPANRSHTSPSKAHPTSPFSKRIRSCAFLVLSSRETAGPRGSAGPGPSLGRIICPSEGPMSATPDGGLDPAFKGQRSLVSAAVLWGPSAGRPGANKHPGFLCLLREDWGQVTPRHHHGCKASLGPLDKLCARCKPSAHSTLTERGPEPDSRLGCKRVPTTAS